MSRPAVPRALPDPLPGLPGLPPGSLVALLVPPSGARPAAYVDVVLGLLAVGVLPVPLDPRLTERERALVLGSVRPDLVVTEGEALAALARDLPPDPHLLLPRARPVHCTSGTTGVPKGVSSGVLTADAAAALVAEERDLWGFRADDVHLVLSPLHHSAPLRFSCGTLLAGGRVVAPGPFDPAVVTAAITDERPTSAFAVPAHLQRLFAHWDLVGTPDVSCFRLLAHAGAPCPEPTKRRLLASFPPGSTWEFYGSTEGQFTACRSEEQLTRPGTVGRARPGRHLTVDDDGTVWCVVPEHARFTYLHAPDKDAAAWRDTPLGPAFTVGDLGRLDDDGYLWLDGRREDLVISGGVNVYPVEVEHALRELDGVDDVAVYGVADARWGQRVCAAVVGPVGLPELEAWARERLSPPKRPKEWHHLDDLPRTLTGKVLRRSLPGAEPSPGA